MYQLGLDEKDILKIFSLYDTEALVETLKYYKSTEEVILKEFFYAKLNFNQGWDAVRSGHQILKCMYKAARELPEP